MAELDISLQEIVKLGAFLASRGKRKDKNFPDPEDYFSYLYSDKELSLFLKTLDEYVNYDNSIIVYKIFDATGDFFCYECVSSLMLKRYPSSLWSGNLPNKWSRKRMCF